MNPQLVNYNGQLINLNGGVLSNKFPIRDGLKLYVDANIDKSYPDSGTVMYDLSKNDLSGSLTNSPGFQEYIPAMVFDGVDDFIDFGDNLDMGTSSMTINCWIKYDSVPTTNWPTFLSKARAAFQDYRYSIGTDNTNKIRIFFNGGAVPDGGNRDLTFFGSTNLAIDTWYFLSIVFDRTDTVRIYINSERDSLSYSTPNTQYFVDPLSGSDLQSINPYRLGVYTSSDNVSVWNGNAFHGKVGMLQHYNRALSEEEIALCYDQTRQRFGHIVEEGLVLNLDSENYNSYPGTGTTWSDLSPSGNDATLVNGPTYQSEPAAIVFDGVNDYATTYDDNNVFQDNDPWTMIAAYKIDDLSATGSMGIIGSQKYFTEPDPGGWGIVIQRLGEGATQTYFRIFLTADDGVTQISSQRVYQTQLECQRWYILAASYNPDTSSLAYYIDGQNQNVTGTAATANDGWTVNKTNRNGLIHKASQGGWNGIDWGASFGEVQVYKRTLTDDEIAYNFEARRGRYGI